MDYIVLGTNGKALGQYTDQEISQMVVSGQLPLGGYAQDVASGAMLTVQSIVDKVKVAKQRGQSGGKSAYNSSGYGSNSGVSSHSYSAGPGVQHTQGFKLCPSCGQQCVLQTHFCSTCGHQFSSLNVGAQGFVSYQQVGLPGQSSVSPQGGASGGMGGSVINRAPGSVPVVWIALGSICCCCIGIPVGYSSIGQYGKGAVACLAYFVLVMGFYNISVPVGALVAGIMSWAYIIDIIMLANRLNKGEAIRSWSFFNGP